MSIDEQVEVLKACKEGKTIQIRDKGSDGDWDNILFSDNKNVNWDFCNYEYRVKPEENPDPMTIKMLTEWLARGNGLVFRIDARDPYYLDSFGCFASDGDLPIEQFYRVKRFGSDEELLPTKELYYKDCSPRKDDFEERIAGCLNKYKSENIN